MEQPNFRNHVSPDDHPDSGYQWQPLFNGMQSEHNPRKDGLYSPAELQALIEHEQVRSRRNGEPNALLICRLNGSQGKERIVRRIVETLTRSVRETDHLGWMSEGELAVVLPGTSAEAAEHLKDKLTENGLSDAVELSVKPF